MSYLARFFMASILVLVYSNASVANDFDISDERIKTMVFNENEVYTVLTRNGFSTAIEISRKEKVMAISIGDSVGWKITPSQDRIFVKPLIKDATTNLSIITDKRTYQFELIVSSSQVRNASHAYVVRFFYPSEGARTQAPSIPAPQPAPVQQFPQSTAPVIPEPPVFSAPSQPAAASASSGLPALGSIGIQPYNFNYTLTGPESSSPRKIFDDGSSTYFEFASVGVSTPQIAAVSSQGVEQPLSVRVSGSKYIVDSVSPRFVIRTANAAEQVCVFNESMLSASASGFAPNSTPTNAFN